MNVQAGAFIKASRGRGPLREPSHRREDEKKLQPSADPVTVPATEGSAMESTKTGAQRIEAARRIALATKGAGWPPGTEAGHVEADGYSAPSGVRCSEAERATAPARAIASGRLPRE